MPDNQKDRPLHDYQLLLKEAFRLAGLPTSVRVSAYNEGIKEIMVGRYKLPGQLWKERQVTISFKDWPNVTLRCTYLKASEKINMAVPDTVFQLGKRIGQILGV